MVIEKFVPTEEQPGETASTAESTEEKVAEAPPEAAENSEEQLDIGDAKEVRLQMRIDSEKYRRIEKVANYAAAEEIIASNHRGNITAWVQYCLLIGEEVVKQHEYQKRGL